MYNLFICGPPNPLPVFAGLGMAAAAPSSLSKVPEVPQSILDSFNQLDTDENGVIDAGGHSVPMIQEFC